MYVASHKSTYNSILPVLIYGIALVSHQNLYHSAIVTILLMVIINAAKNSSRSFVNSRIDCQCLERVCEKA